MQAIPLFEMPGRVLEFSDRRLGRELSLRDSAKAPFSLEEDFALPGPRSGLLLTCLNLTPEAGPVGDPAVVHASILCLWLPQGANDDPHCYLV